MVMAGQAAAWAQSAAPPTPISAWPVSTAPARFTIERVPSSPPGVLGSVDLTLPEQKWLTMPFRVFNELGLPVGSDLLWSAPGEPVTLIFDATSNSKKFQVYVGSNWPPLHLPDKEAGVWLETREGDGAVIAHGDDMLKAWKQSENKVVGRALIDGIYEGGNRFGSQRNLFLHFQGWFDLVSPTHLDFAPISTDATFVFVDGKNVVEWPGTHDWRTPPSGPPQGGIDLPAGRHGVDYYNAYVVPSAPLLCTLAIKGGPFPQWTSQQPTKSIFRPATQYQVTGYDLQSAPTAGATQADAPTMALSQHLESESIIQSDLDVGFISLEMTTLPASTGTLTWTFDDGTSVQGATVKHLFARPGVRTVQVAVQEGDKPVTILTQTLHVHPQWVGMNGGSAQLHPEHKADILGRDPAKMSASDLVSCYAILGNYQEWDSLLKFVPALCAKMPGVAETDLPFLRDVVLAQVPGDRAHYAEEIQLLRAMVDRAGQGKPSPDTVALANKMRLVLARMLLATTDQIEDVRKILDAITPETLADEERRSLAILRADLTLATGDVASAKKQYEDLTGQPSGPDVRSSIRRTGRIGQARAYLDAKDIDSAEDALREVARDAPIEKLAPDWALTELRLKQDEKLPALAYLWAKRLLPVIKGNDRSELLFRLADLAFAQNDSDLAHKSLSELLKKYPYSAEAAQAKEKWPGAE
jgi:PKD domain